ncbi:MAG TPA: RHS repeat-associated core domain-containing protein [Thermoanaerobaculia bacterium]|nr:RHS repeat-associated core domain-containing protein [Thermoanaerobaculia bacterium]
MKRTRSLLTAAVLLSAAPAAQATVPGFGTYRYDGAGNIIEAVGESYTYDTFARLQTATAGGHQQEFVYDRYGNIRSITTDGNAGLAVKPGVNPATNWANLTHDLDTGLPNNMVTRHDPSGNVEIAPGGSFEYDALDTVTVSTVDGVRRLHLYSASDERLATLTATAAGHRSDWTVRDPAGRVLRRFASDGAGAWQWTGDYIYAGSGQLLAAEVPAPEKIRHFHLDHLGTPRLTTGNGGAELARHTYYAFGGELPDAIQDGERRKFTGHERDSASLDYMHARYYQPVMGRFLSVDRARNWEKAVALPQKWNRYAYARNSPLNFFDPDGFDEIRWGKQKVTVNPGEVLVIQSAKGGHHVATYVQSGKKGEIIVLDSTNARNADLSSQTALVRSRLWNNTDDRHFPHDIRTPVNGRPNAFSPDSGAVVLGVVHANRQVGAQELLEAVPNVRQNHDYAEGQQCTTFAAALANEAGYELENIDDPNDLEPFLREMDRGAVRP